MYITRLNVALHKGLQGRNLLILMLGIGLVGINYLPLPPGLTINGLRVLVVLLLAVTLWVTEIIHPAVTAMVIIVVLPLMQVITFEKSLAGFADTSMALLVAIYILTGAMVKSGLDRRLAFLLLSLSQGKIKENLLMIALTVIAFTFLVPTSAGRAALMVPICRGMASSMGLKPGSNIGKAMFLIVSFTSLIFSSSLLTGSLSMIYAMSLFQRVGGYSWNYLHWMAMMLPGSLITTFLVWLLLLKVFPPEVHQISKGRQYIREQLVQLGTMTTEEKKVGLLFFGMLILWITSYWHHLPVALVAVLAATLTFFPGFNLQSWKEAMLEVDWGTVILFGGSLSLASALKETGAMDWLATLAFGNIRTNSVMLLGLTIMVICIIIRLGFNSVLGASTVILPMVMATATNLKLNPIWLGMIGVVGSELCMFLPTQSPTLLATYGAGFYTTRDTLRAGSLTTFLLMAVTLIMAYFYWPLLGINPR
ncbi:SLC13 family permease [Neomoorella mulderi]|uniref:Sodium-dependent dicarboxylate transporter SdcS n=1 Tax=Moorella mulderi DSM 14980 TaxID=1122241 RepID=A0A151AX41_9FIRM|nr:DASS family sodium-coupled anion symporter [Moorella mulderi]KYH32215.1 sodium-dependent dicarboxylate transporter SdcS [Moorella mulderi DSM 14980]